MERWTAILGDEDPETVACVRDALLQRDYDVVMTSPGGVVEAAQGYKRALVLLGRSSTDLDPWFACRKLHEAADRHHVICLLDGHDTDSFAAAFAAGADDALTKPLMPSELDARLGLAKRLMVLEEVRSTLEDEGALLAEISTRASFHSRRYLQSELTNELTRARRFAHALAVIVAEAQHREGGERVMRAFGQVLSRLCRSRIDWIARHGEHSYAVVLPETDLAGALRAAERLRTAVPETSDLPKSLFINIGVSALHPGSTVFAEKVGPDLLLHAAEQYLKDAVRKGPGQIAGGPAPHK
jgi:diguanylate cyclase (GGDEF)-like protein